MSILLKWFSEDITSGQINVPLSSINCKSHDPSFYISVGKVIRRFVFPVISADNYQSYSALWRTVWSMRMEYNQLVYCKMLCQSYLILQYNECKTFSSFNIRFDIRY